MSGRLVLVALVGVILLAGSAAGKPRSSETRTAASIAAGGSEGCATTTAGIAFCWGANGYGQLGDGTRRDRYVPVAVSGLGSGVRAMSPGAAHSCALTVAGGAKCWGWNLYGQVGDGSNEGIRLTPVEVAGLSSGVAEVSAGGSTCALTTAGAVKCWGPNRYGQLGDGTKTDRRTPVDVSGLSSGVRAISAGADHACALTLAGGVKCWGRNAYGAIGDGTHQNRLTPVDVTGLTSGVTAVASGSDYSCALTDGGGVRCWGDNVIGELGDGTTTNRKTPVDVRGLSTGVSAIAVGPPSCALLDTAAVLCWGWRSHKVPYAIPGLAAGAQAIAAGAGYFACALVAGGGIKCWGNNFSGQLGDGTGESHDTATSVVGFGSGRVCVVPNVKGKRLTRARRAIKRSHCRVGKVTRAFSRKVRRGRVIGQYPAHGSRLNGGFRVELRVSKGKAACVVPDVYGKTFAEAKRLIKNHGCRLGKVTREFAFLTPKGKVYSQSPPPRASFGKAKPINLVISKGTQKLGPPRVAGLSADGARVAIHMVRRAQGRACHELWIRRRNGKAVVIRAGCSSEFDNSRSVTSFALASRRVAWVDYDFGNYAYCYLETASVSHSKVSDTGFCNEGGGQYVGHLAGDGRLFVFNSWGMDVGVWRLTPSGNAVQVVAGAAAGKVKSADAGRIALRKRSGAIGVYTAKGALLRRFAIKARTAKLDGSTLVAQEGTVLRQYDLSKGTAGKSRPLRSGKSGSFRDVASGIAVYIVKGTVRLIRLSDGKRASIRATRKGHAYAEIERPGLFYASSRRVRFIPMRAVRRLFR
jgi:alpha-tubulin suppressor-like RCC1 family protein